jgi:uncharacterized protein YndB with AHSA1/START domain
VAINGSVTRTVHVPADDAFALVTDVRRLPEWNAVVTRVIECPAALVRDAEWLVELRAMGMSWTSRSRVLELDTDARRFVYRSSTDDGNPSYAIWTWTVVDDGGEVRITVGWELHPKTLFRRTLGAPMRNHQLRREVRHSVDSLEQLARHGAETP